jgi:hypothetical protein
MAETVNFQEILGHSEETQSRGFKEQKVVRPGLGCSRWRRCRQCSGEGGKEEEQEAH